MAAKSARAKKPAQSVKPEPTFEVSDFTPEALAFLHVFSLGCGKIGYKFADASIDNLKKRKLKGPISLPADVTIFTSALLAEFEKFAHSLAAKRFKIVDGWRGKSKVNTGSNVRRYELEEVTSL